jgi:hypothetical protein
MMILRSAPARALVPTLLLAALVRGQENLELGKMWTFENPPLAYLEQEYGFKPTQEWLDAVRLAAVRYGDGCSASFVSPKGLIMTNHHCARENIDAVSPPGQDWGSEGHYATSYASEVKIPDLTVQQLIGMRDVTADMNSGVGDADDDKTVDAKREKNRQRILEAATKEKPDLKPEIVTLYNGAMFQLYQYKIWSDIRLVCAPHLKAAYFGGDPDNFTYPRFCFDFTFVRAYENDKPADTSAHYYKFSDGPKEGELVFTVGNPGSTGRLLTLAQLERMRDVYYPLVLEVLDGLIRAQQDYAKSSQKAEQEVRTEMFSNANTQKAFTGYHAGLVDTGRMERKRTAEAAFKARIDGLPMAKKRFAGAWSALAEVAQKQKELEPKRRLQTLSYGNGISFSKELELADLIVRAGHPDVSADGQKNARKLAAEFKLEPTPFEAASMQRLFVEHMARAQRWLAKDDPYLRVMLAGKSAEQRYAELKGQSQLKDAGFVKQLLDGGHEAVARCNDIAIQIALAVVPMAQKNRREWDEVALKERVNGSRIGQALFAAYGTKVSPDATFTLRLSDGVVRGYAYNGTLAPAQTSMFGLFARSAEFANQDPFDLPRAFVERRDQIDMFTPVNFVSTNDIIGGNSGSPMINVKREIVGLIFDGNIEQLPNRFLYDEKGARSVSVHPRAMLEVLRKVYDAGALADELAGK